MRKKSIKKGTRKYVNIMATEFLSSNLSLLNKIFINSLWCSLVDEEEKKNKNKGPTDTSFMLGVTFYMMLTSINDVAYFYEYLCAHICP